MKIRPGRFFIERVNDHPSLVIVRCTDDNAIVATYDAHYGGFDAAELLLACYNYGGNDDTV